MAIINGERSSNNVSVELVKGNAASLWRDPDLAIYELDRQIDMLRSKADGLDYLVAACSGILCGALDTLWVGELDLTRGREWSSETVDGFVTQIAKLTGYNGSDVRGAVAHLERIAPIPSDANTSNFGGGLQHHLRDFAHHPTVAGLAFSLLTQFTGKTYGTATNGVFLVVDVPAKALGLIGETVPEKLLFGTVTWFLHLVSDMAGSSATAGFTGGAGIPGPLLSLAKELSALPLFKNVTTGDIPFSVMLSKLFNGTLLAQHDEAGNIIKDTALRLDLRGELGALAELGRQTLPVIANECAVRGFYLLRHLASEMARVRPGTLKDLQAIEWSDVKPFGNPTVDRMLTIATAAFTGVDVTAAAASETWWVSVNYVGVCRFAFAVGKDVSWTIRARDLKRIRTAYETIRRNSYTMDDNTVYDSIGNGLGVDRFGLTAKQTEILYNMERQKVLFDIERLPKKPFGAVRATKQEWLDRWQASIAEGFPSFIGDVNATLSWMDEDELYRTIEDEGADGVWFRLALLEAMLFEPYYSLSPEDEAGNALKALGANIAKTAGDVIQLGYGQGICDKMLDEQFAAKFIEPGYIKRLRRCHTKVMRKLNEVLKAALITVSVTSLVALATVATAGIAAPSIAVALVGSNFTGLGGAALTSACLAYIGGGAVAAGGAGMAGGITAIVGGGAVLGLGAGGVAGAAAGTLSTLSERNAILQSAKLLTAVQEIFLNDEHEVEYSQSVLARYVDLVSEEQSSIKRREFETKTLTGKEKKEAERQIKETKRAIDAMERAWGYLNKFTSSFEVGTDNEKTA